MLLHLISNSINRYAEYTHGQRKRKQTASYQQCAILCPWCVNSTFTAISLCILYNIYFCCYFCCHYEFGFSKTEPNTSTSTSISTSTATHIRHTLYSLLLPFEQNAACKFRLEIRQNRPAAKMDLYISLLFFIFFCFASLPFRSGVFCSLLPKIAVGRRKYGHSFYQVMLCRMPSIHANAHSVHAIIRYPTHNIALARCYIDCRHIYEAQQSF